MKQSVKFLAITLMITSICFTGMAQGLKAKTDKASTIYVAPLKYYNYYGIKTQVLQTGEKFAGQDYSASGTYSIGDQVKNINDVYTIVGELPDAELAAINANLMARCEEFFGADKIKVWPEGVKKKDVDCDFYIILSRAAWGSPVKLKTFVFNENDDEYKMMGDMENIKITIFEKVKAGKKGKKVFSESKGVFFKVDPVVYKNTGEEAELNAAAEFITTKANKALADKVNMLLDEFFAKCDSAK